MAFDSFLKIQGIDGESLDKNHLGWIEIESFSWGVSNPHTASSGGGGSGRPSQSDFNFQTLTSKASPNLMLACALGRNLGEVDLTCRKAGGPSQVEFLKIKLYDCFVSSYQESGGAEGQDPVPIDSFSIFFDKCDFAYTVARTGEMVETAFDFRFDPAGG